MSALEPYLGAAKALAIVAAALSLFALGHHYGAQGVQADWNKDKLAQAEADAAANETYRLKERAMSKQVEEARNAATIRETALRRDADGARLAADGLRDDLADLRRQLPQLAADACRQRADTLAELFQQCEGNYRGLAEKADRHVSDVQTLRDGWPR
jgi:hypothetical protein